MRTFTTGWALAAGIALSTVVPGFAAAVQHAPATAPAAGCETRKMPDKDNSKYAKLFTNNSTNIRNGPNCTAIGHGQKSHRVDLHCYTTQWSYIRDVETNVAGWVRNDGLEKTPDAVCPT